MDVSSNLMNIKKAIIVASFGTSYNETRAKTIDAIEADVADAFEGWDVRRAFTSRMIIKKLKERDGVEIDYIDGALERLVNDGYEDVVVLPTLMFNGIEYEDIIRISSEFIPKFKSFHVAKPLLSEESDFDELNKTILNEIRVESKELAGEDSSLILMGHGTHHYSNGAFPEIQLKLFLTDAEDVFVTTVEGFPRFDDLDKMMARVTSKDVVLTPLMLVAGDHAMNDMVGDSPDSLRCILESKGYDVHSILKGLAEYESVRRIFIRHVQDSMTE